MNRGFTLLEVILSIFLISILTLVIGQFASWGLGYSVKSASASRGEQSINSSMVFLEENISDKTGIDVLRGIDIGVGVEKNHIGSRSRIRLRAIFFKNEVGERIGSEPEGFGLRFLKSENKLFYRKLKAGPRIMECLDGIEELYIEPIPQGASYGEAYGIRLIFKTSGPSDLEVARVIYFKNHRDRIGDVDG